VSENGRDKGMCVNCEAMGAESEARGQGVSARALSTCRVAGAEAVTWSEMAESEANASPSLTGSPTSNGNTEPYQDSRTSAAPHEHASTCAGMLELLPDIIQHHR